jgi:hypothetical protein
MPTEIERAEEEFNFAEAQYRSKLAQLMLLMKQALAANIGDTGTDLEGAGGGETLDPPLVLPGASRTL